MVNILARLGNVANVWLTILVQWRRNANDDGDTFCNTRKISAGRKSLGVHLLSNGVRLDVMNLRSARIDCVDLDRVDIESQNANAIACKLKP